MSEKPITVARNDFLEGAVCLINESGLPAFVIAGVLRDILVSIDKLAAEQLAQDTESYKQRVKHMVTQNAAKTQRDAAEKQQKRR